MLDDPVVAGIIADVWRALPGWFPTIAWDEFVVMPNHVHLIVWLHGDGDKEAGAGDVGATLAVAQTHAVTPRTGANPDPTDADDSGGPGDVGATLAVAQTHAVTPRTGANPDPTDADDSVGPGRVGATLAVAQTRAVTPRAGANPDPTDADDSVGAGVVGATLAVAQTRAITPRTGANSDPTDADDSVGPGGGAWAGDVGATLAVAQTRAVTPRAGANPAPTWVIPDAGLVNMNPTLGNVVGTFKSLVFAVYLDWVQRHDPTRRAKFWQRNYYEHIIRNERDLDAIRRYIRQNPARWALDRDNPNNRDRLPFPTQVEDYLADVQGLMEMDDGE